MTLLLRPQAFSTPALKNPVTRPLRAKEREDD